MLTSLLLLGDNVHSYCHHILIIINIDFASFFVSSGDPNPQSAVPKIGFISGTKGNDDCLCLPNGQDTSEEICPVRSTRPIYPWKRKGTRNRDKAGNDGTFRFDYDDYDYFNRLGGGDDGIDPGVKSNVRGSVENLPDAENKDVEPITPRLVIENTIRYRC